MIKTPEEALEYINKIIDTAGFNKKKLEIVNKPLQSEQFISYPASVPESAHEHQAFEGGLLVHTAQVLQGALGLLETVNESADYEKQRKIVIMAAIWHDIGKIFDYKKNEDGSYSKTLHHMMIHHIPQGYAVFQTFSIAAGLDEAFMNCVSHAILAHHGRLEWHSPVEPITLSAWAIHLADMYSAKNGF